MQSEVKMWKKRKGLCEGGKGTDLRLCQKKGKKTDKQKEGQNERIKNIDPKMGGLRKDRPKGGQFRS